MTILNKEKILEVARAFIDEGKLDKAIREYEKILLAEPDDLKVKLRVAELYTKRKQINEAIRIYREVAESYTSEGFLLKAVTVFKNILRLNPSLVEVNEELAGLYEKMGLTNDAIRQYDILASTLDMKGMGERVVEVRKKIVSLNIQDGSARIRLAELLQREGDTDGAIDQYEQYAAQVEKDGSDKRKLADLYEKILAHRPSNAELIRKLIDLYEGLGEHKKALKWLESAKDMVENDASLLKLAATIYSSQNQHETARMKYMQLADLETKSGNIEAVLDAYLEILVQMPDEEDRLFNRVEELKAGGMEELKERAVVRRKELEEEEIRRQVAEQQAEEATDKGRMPSMETEPEKAKPEEKSEKVEKEQAKPEPKPEPKIETPKEDVKASPEPKPKPTPQPKPVAKKPKADKAKADAAYGLGVTYRKMGLHAEAKRELKKAFDIYSAWLEEGNDESSVLERVKSIEASLAGASEVEAQKVEEPRAPVKKSESAKTKEEKSDKPKPEGKKESKEPAKKKRISFV